MVKTVSRTASATVKGTLAVDLKKERVSRKVTAWSEVSCRPKPESWATSSGEASATSGVWWAVVPHALAQGPGQEAARPRPRARGGVLHDLGLGSAFVSVRAARAQVAEEGLDSGASSASA